MLAQIGVFLGLVGLAGANCGGELIGDSGTITSPNYPSNYGNNVNCVWTVPAGVTLTFDSSFEIEDHVTCNYDYLKVDGQKFCGSNVPFQINVEAGRTITFKSDSSINKMGFSATYSRGYVIATTPRVTTRVTPAGCGGVFEGESGIVQSPNYPNNYDNNMDCEYTITIPEGIVKLTFDDFDVEESSTCGYDYLEILENGVSKSILCGGSAGVYKASSKSVSLRFKTDGSEQKKGWRLKYGRHTCQADRCVQSSLCNGRTTNDYCPGEGHVCCLPDVNSPAGCGISKKTRIVGGNHTSRHEWPWQASLQTTSSSFHFCGATLINEWFGLTAAHCVDGSSASSMKVVLGEHHVTANHEDVDPVTMSLSKVIMHENYDGNGGGFPNDIALVKFTRPVTFTAQIVPACLPPPDMEIFGNENCWISGWGNTQDAGQESEILNELRVKIIDQSTCTTKWGESYINAGHVCLNNGLTGACNGDSGGPLSCKGDDGKWYVNGATSWGRSGCQTRGYPSVYSRVTYFREWIVNSILNNM